MQIIISAVSAAAVILSPIHISYGMIISKETSWISWLEMIYRVNQWASPPKPESAKTNCTGWVKAKKFLDIFSFFYLFAPLKNLLKKVKNG